MNTNLINDPCYMQRNNRSNQKINDLRFETFNSTLDAVLGKVGVYQSRGIDYNGEKVNIDSQMRLSQQIKDKSKSCINSRPFLTVPYMGPGQTSVINSDLHSSLIMTETSRQKLSEIDDPRFIPLLPSLRSEQGQVEPFCRSGVSSRGVRRALDYKKECLRR